MKKILFILQFTYCAISAQDTIVLRNGSVVLSKVSEVNVNDVRYFRWDNLSGPVYVAEKISIEMITYINGTQENFPASEIGKLDRYMTNSYLNLSIGEKECWSILKQKNNPQINNCLRKAKYCKISQPITFIGIPLAGASVLSLLCSAFEYTPEARAKYQQAAGIFAALGAVSLSSAIYLKSTRKAQTRKAIEIYNQTYNP
jgi:hypothetical protein